jgi:hypothetical protein
VSWQILLEGAWKDRASESIQAIVDDLARRPEVGGASLAEGAAGLALLHGYLAQTPVGRISNPSVFPDGLEIHPTWLGQDQAAVAADCLGRATAAMADNPTSASLHSGLTGVGWAVGHLRGRVPGLDGEDDAAAIDEVLLDHLGRSPWAEDYDLIDGLVGFGVYALERLPRPAAVACLGRVIDRLAETAERRPEGVTWWTNPEWLPAPTRERFPRGYYNLGLAHGVPGVIALLASACAAGVAGARPLLEGAVSWLLAQQGPGGFAYWVGPGADPAPARLAWCYGDPGVATALLGAARSVGEPAWEFEALAIARRAARRPPEGAGVVDAGLCHGAAGLGHVFNRLFQATGEPWLAEAAHFWLTSVLALRRPGRGVGGYEAWRLGDGGAGTWAADPGLLSGAAGVALALLAATSPVEPSWDRVLLLAVPPAAS